MFKLQKGNVYRKDKTETSLRMTGQKYRKPHKEQNHSHLDGFRYDYDDSK